jgi:NADP-dependent 3-hydroxy acid dehydrogenase YdfG
MKHQFCKHEIDFILWGILKNSTNIKEIANKERLPLYVLYLDVNDGVSLKNAIEKILRQSGRIDVLANNTS